MPFYRKAMENLALAAGVVAAVVVVLLAVAVVAL